MATSNIKKFPNDLYEHPRVIAEQGSSGIQEAWRWHDDHAVQHSPLCLIKAQQFATQYLHIDIHQKLRVFMHRSYEHKLVRLNIQIPKDMRDQLAHASSRQGMNISALVRESIKEKITQLNSQWLEADLRAAYEGMAEENAQLADEFRFTDAENLDGE